MESAWAGLVGVGGWVLVLDLGVTLTKVMVTGASRGIGAAIARQFAVRGFELAIVARRESALEALCDELLKLGASTATYRTADLSDLGQVTSWPTTWMNSDSMCSSTTLQSDTGTPRGTHRERSCAR
jgi:shikimate 5-dehydrogenase